MNTKHTPGPWHTGDASHALDVYDEAGWPVASIPFSFAPRKAGENVCNAHLIAAAPDMLDALEGLLNALPSATTHPSVAQARRAIAKARGEA